MNKLQIHSSCCNLCQGLTLLLPCWLLTDFEWRLLIGPAQSRNLSDTWSEPHIIFFLSHLHLSTTVVRADNCSKNSLNFFQMKIFNIKKNWLQFLTFTLLCTYDIYSAFKIMYPITVQLYHVQLWVCRTGLTICIPIRKQSQSFCIIPMALLMPYCRSLHLASKLNLLLKENSHESTKF